jgi:UDP-2,4-diacetamido-2,4,6-trideoxy-beta-L-altropyranose hydrolase
MTSPGSSKILFYANGGPGIGDGHLMRCLALAKAVLGDDRSAEVRLCTSTRVAYAIEAWRGAGIAVDPIAASDGPARLDALGHAATGWLPNRVGPGCGWLVIDNYDVPPDVTAALAQRVRVAQFDDEALFSPPADLVVNQNPGAEIRFAASYPDAGALALGPRHACLRPEILSAARGAVRPRAGVVVAFGNSQPDGLSRAVAQALATAGYDEPIRCVLPERMHFEPPTANTSCLVPQDLAPLLAEARIAVIGGGVTALEAACLGTPAVVFVLAENQRPGAEALEQAGSAIVAANPEAAASEILVLQQSGAALKKMAHSGQYLVDGKGADRVAQLLLRSCADPSRT